MGARSMGTDSVTIEDLLERTVLSTGLIGRHRARIANNRAKMNAEDMEAFERLVEYSEYVAEAFKAMSKELETRGSG